MPGSNGNSTADPVLNYIQSVTDDAPDVPRQTRG